MPSSTAEHLDVLIIGAGLSGIGAACRLQAEHPQRSLAVLEARDGIGGTWDLFRYPGIRSDSDMFTLGYDFKPWKGKKSITDGDSIREYLMEAAREHGVDRLIRFHHRVTAMEWSSADARWTVRAVRTDTGEDVVLTCSVLYGCTGYYRYDSGYTPDFAGVDEFAGRVVHPQQWPADLDLTGQRVVIIGSGATAMTLVPALASTAAHVTMLQRSPTYVLTLPAVDPLADLLRRVLPERRAYEWIRWIKFTQTNVFYNLCRRFPTVMRRVLLRQVALQLPSGYPVEEHFGPRYDPWDERLCIVPDSDLFRAIRSGAASVVTDHIDRFTPTGIRLVSGEEVPADVVVTATGLQLLFGGGAAMTVDGQEVDPATRFAYKGMMLDGVPNFVFTIGYINASWTLRADLIADLACRLLRHLDATGMTTFVAEAPQDGERRPFLDLTSGYVRRAAALLPASGSHLPWQAPQDYRKDRRMMRRRDVADEGLVFSRPATPPPSSPDEPARQGELPAEPTSAAAVS